ncbi:MAG: hypothetical protein AAB229_04065 [Candidatus Hydrogenedentota bacterium]
MVEDRRDRLRKALGGSAGPSIFKRADQPDPDKKSISEKQEAARKPEEDSSDIAPLLQGLLTPESRDFVRACHEHLKDVEQHFNEWQNRLNFLKESSELVCRFVAFIIARKLDYFLPKEQQDSEYLFRLVREQFDREQSIHGMKFHPGETISPDKRFDDAMLLPHPDDSQEAAQSLSAEGRPGEAALMYARLDLHDRAAAELSMAAGAWRTGWEGDLMEQVPLIEWVLKRHTDADLQQRTSILALRYLGLDVATALEEKMRFELELAREPMKDLIAKRNELAAERASLTEEDHLRTIAARGLSSAAEGSIAGLLLGAAFDAAATGPDMNSRASELSMSIRTIDQQIKSCADLVASHEKRWKERMPELLGERRCQAYEFLMNHMEEGDSKREALIEQYFRLLDAQHQFDTAAGLAMRTRQSSRAKSYHEAARIVFHATIGDVRRKLLVTTESEMRKLFKDARTGLLKLNWHDVNRYPDSGS